MHRTVLLEFPWEEQAHTRYESNKYQAIAHTGAPHRTQT